LPVPSTSAGPRAIPASAGGKHASGEAACTAHSNARLSSSCSGKTLGTQGLELAARARSSSTATAGSFLPSKNSRNAPPPVEMYEILSVTPN
jgi:hypothetical protein